MPLPLQVSLGDGDDHIREMNILHAHTVGQPPLQSPCRRTVEKSRLQSVAARRLFQPYHDVLQKW